MPIIITAYNDEGEYEIELLSVYEAAKETGLSASNIARQCRRGKIAAQKLGREWAIEHYELKRYSKEQKEAHGPKKKPKSSVPSQWPPIHPNCNCSVLAPCEEFEGTVTVPDMRTLRLRTT